MGHAIAATHGRPACHEYSLHLFTALAGWLKLESRCLAEYAPEPNPETKKKDVVWFATAVRIRRHLDRVQGRPRH
jgi:hypothetical protein